MPSVSTDHDAEKVGGGAETETAGGATTGSLPQALMWTSWSHYSPVPQMWAPSPRKQQRLTELGLMESPGALTLLPRLGLRQQELGYRL